MKREIFLPCPCGKVHKIPDPGKPVCVKCKASESLLFYECREGEEFRLRGSMRDYILAGEKIDIGRQSSNHVAINDNSISRCQCRLYFTGSGYEIIDLDSSNGTYLNERRLLPGTKALLQAGDLLRLGDVRLRYIEPQIPEEITEHHPDPGEDETSDIEQPGEFGALDDTVADGGTVVQDTATRAEEKDPLVGKIIATYRIKSLLSQGGMGRIYLASHVSLKRECVIKTIIPEKAESEKTVQRFLREIVLGAKIWHQNVVTFYDAGEHENFCYLAMEYFPGETLFDLFYEKPAKADVVAEIGKQAASALAAAHSQGIIHRDIKPRNILMNEQNRIKIVDFGVAKACLEQDQASLTLSGAMLGTPMYMAPEQVADSKNVTPAIDIYALGAVLYFCITGKPPYSGRTGVQVMRQVGKGVVRPGKVRKGVPLVLEGIIMKAMAADPARRYSSAEEMLAALEKLR
jgi:tRNA A-37 threonylcarbamoyl transferase component Bud32